MSDETQNPNPGAAPSPNPAPSSSPAPSPNPAPWYGTPDSDTMGYLQARGWDRLEAPRVALEAIKAHREAERLVGAPQDQLLRIPAQDDVDGWNKVYSRLGRPEKKEGYDFSVFKTEQGEPLLDQDQTAVLQDLAHGLNLSSNQATLLVQKLAQITENEMKNQNMQAAGENARQMDELKAKWLTNSIGNKLIAENAARLFGLDPSVLATNGAPVTLPYSAALEMFRQIGVKVGEDKFVNSAGGSNAPMTPDEAQYRVTQLMGDQVWQNKFNKGDVQAVNEFQMLTKLITEGRLAKRGY